MLFYQDSGLLPFLPPPILLCNWKADCMGINHICSLAMLKVTSLVITTTSAFTALTAFDNRSVELLGSSPATSSSCHFRSGHAQTISP